MSAITLRDRGFTLIELMITLVLGLIVVGGVMAVFISTYQSNAQNIKMVRLNEEMRAVMSMMSRDIRRSGVRELAWQPSLLGSPNLFATNLNWVVSRFGTEAANSCVLFAYDSDGANDVVDANNGPGSPPAFLRDRFGYRLQAGAVRLRTNGTNQCADAAGWERITDENVVQILNLNFTTTLEPPLSGLVDVRTVIITLQGATHTRSGAPATVTTADCTNIDVACRTLVEKIRLRNDAVL